MHDDEVTEEELLGNEGLFFRTRVEVAMRVHGLSPDEAIDYVSERVRMAENGYAGGCHIAASRHCIGKSGR